jgi:hypothetical protein
MMRLPLQHNKKKEREIECVEKKNKGATNGSNIILFYIQKDSQSLLLEKCNVWFLLNE